MRRLLPLLACVHLPVALAASPQDVTLPSGVIVQTYREGESGASPTPADVVRVHYQGTLADGRQFDSSYTRGQPAELPLEALQAVEPRIGPEVAAVLGVENSVRSRTSEGGTAPDNVRREAQRWVDRLKSEASAT